MMDTMRDAGSAAPFVAPLVTIALAMALLATAACGDRRPVASQTAGLSRAEATRRARALEEIGRQMFVDPSLSGSGTMACASCHSPQHAFGPPNARATQPGGKALDRVGLRAVPSLRYLQARPPFTEHFFESEDDGDESIDAGPTGGLTWDGRVNRGRDQARIPLLSPDEMANDSLAHVVAAVAKAPYAAQMRQIFGDAIFSRSGNGGSGPGRNGDGDRPDADAGAGDAKAFDAIGSALAAYEQREADFYPYSSKYDASLAGEVQLSAQEQRGLALFEDPAKGNCARCHISARGKRGTPPQFTDYGFIALGVPRNAQLPANADRNYYDLGLCGPLRTDLMGKTDYCGKFMTPSLRNTATRQAFFHNGVLHSLREVVAFYAQRDAAPEKWYPRDADGQGGVRKFDDLPARYQANVDREPPFGRQPGEPPALTDQEIDDVVAFLQTLTDGFRRQPAAPTRSP
jgi:cytochrome c peroxidase